MEAWCAGKGYTPNGFTEQLWLAARDFYRSPATDAEVEAAARAGFDLWFGDTAGQEEWEDSRDLYMDLARVALTAARKAST